MVVEASGGAFTKKYSHEFQVLTDAGEDYIVYCSACNFAQNKEVAKGKVGESCLQCGNGTLAEGKSVEVGNIFKLGTKFSEDFKLNFTTESGEQQPVIMASYGIGPGRLLGTIVEVHHDDAGLCWPEAVAPYKVHLIVLAKEPEIRAKADELYNSLVKHGVETLYDDRDESAGVKLNDADLLGLPWRVVIGSKTGDKVELKFRTSAESTLISAVELLNKFSVQ